MSTTLLVGLDGRDSGERALEYGKSMAKLIGECELLLVYVIEWSPYSFQTPEENEKRHQRREEEISMATSRVVDPAVKAATEAGFKARGIVRHGDVANTLIQIAESDGAAQIIVGRSSEGGFSQRIFGSASSNLVQSASVPVTVVN